MSHEFLFLKIRDTFWQFVFIERKNVYFCPDKPQIVTHKLDDEIKGQGEAKWNLDATVKPGNFSAVGYFLSVRIDYSYVQVEVVNVSTGEYERNVTVNL